MGVRKVVSNQFYNIQFYFLFKYYTLNIFKLQTIFK